jgi:hypothetical protein
MDLFGPLWGWGQPSMNQGRKSVDKSRAKIPSFMMALVPRFSHPTRLGLRLECCATRVGRGQVTYFPECSQFEPPSPYYVYFTASSILIQPCRETGQMRRITSASHKALSFRSYGAAHSLAPSVCLPASSRSPRGLICVHHFLFIDNPRPDIEGSCLHGAMTAMTATMQGTLLEWGEEGSEMSPGVQSVEFIIALMEGRALL